MRLRCCGRNASPDRPDGTATYRYEHDGGRIRRGRARLRRASRAEPGETERIATARPLDFAHEHPPRALWYADRRSAAELRSAYHIRCVDRDRATRSAPERC